MTRFLVATASVHTTAAACDYLAERVGPDDTAEAGATDADEVLVLSVVSGDHGERDAGDALNVASVRLHGAQVETLTREGDPATVVGEVATERDVDEVIVGVRSGAGDDGPADDEASGLGSTAGRILAVADRPVVVLPDPSPA